MVAEIKCFENWKNRKTSATKNVNKAHFIPNVQKNRLWDFTH